MKAKETNEYYEYIKDFFEEAKKNYSLEEFEVSAAEIQSMLFFAATFNFISMDESDEMRDQVREYWG